MNPGTPVRLTSDPGRHGVTTGKSRTRGDRLFWQVRFSDGSDYISEKQLEIIQTDAEDGVDLFSAGKFGRARDLRGAITHIRLSGKLADLIYSMETTNTDFYPYQFKPVLNFLDSPSRGLLIADEVGLGKTIEAGLIWTELRSRYDTRRLMVLCPAMLRDKWERELQIRFGIKATIVDSSETVQAFVDYKEGNIKDFAIIGSMQGLRPNRGWNDYDADMNTGSSTLAKYLSENVGDEPLLDLLIIDEAHYLRNPQSMTSSLGRLLRDVAEHMILLSATPIHLHNQDLFNLLNLVDEDSFNQINVFDDILEANAPVIRARDMILRDSLDYRELLPLLKEAQSHLLLKDNRQLQALIDNPPEEKDLQNKAYRSELSYRLESINLLGHAVTRTRKREVTEWRVVREAVPEIVDLTPVEEKFYTRVTELVREYCLKHDAHEGFLLVTPQRQISSSMPAALREWQRRRFEFDQMYEDTGQEIDNGNEIGPLVQLMIDNAGDLGELRELWDNDSKYHRLSRELKRYLKDHPKEKVVLFAYFRPTLYYLQERLSAEGIQSVVLVGGGNTDKNEILAEFQDPKGPSVLLASEVASEGIDLQFSRVVINYDLPWNPMKVEQRIGRIDRLGQHSPKITIWNLFYANTIDSRIYDRLYMRLGIFEYALGGLEAVLGEQIKKLTIDLLRGALTPKQEEDRIAQTEQALSNLKDEEERLEQNANNLIAHGDYILHQVRAARELGRWITGEDLWIYARDFFNTKYAGCEFRKLHEDDLVFEVKLSENARFDLDRFLQSHRLSGQTKLTMSGIKPVLCRFKNQVHQQNVGSFEHVNQFHPLTRFISDSIQKSLGRSEIVYFPAVSLRLNRREVPAFLPKDFIFHVERWTIQGVRDIERMVYIVKAFDESLFLTEEAAEQLVTSAARAGTDWLSAANEINISLLTPILEQCMDAAEKKYAEYVAVVENENNDRADLQEKTLKLHLERQRDKLNGVLQKHQERGNFKMVAPTRGQIEKMETRVKDRLRSIQESRSLQHHKKDVCLGVIRVE